MNNYFFFAAFIAFAFAASAQEIKVKEDYAKIGGASNPVLTVYIGGADQTTVEKAWKSLMKDYGAKVSYKDVLFSQDANIKDMSTKTVDTYATAEPQKDGTVKLTVAFDLGGGFVSSSTHPDQYKIAEKMVRKFAVDVSKQAVSDKLWDEKKKQKTLEGNLADLQKAKSKLEKEILDYQDRIKDDQKDIETNKSDQVKATQQIEDQKKVVDDVQQKLDAIK